VSRLQLCSLVKHYRSEQETVRAVDGVSLDLLDGEFIALYGPSGSGKTTLLLMAAGLLTPDSGQVLFDGRDISAFTRREMSDHLRRTVGLVFQSFHLMGGASALNNASLKLLADGVSPKRARERARPWLDRVGLFDRHDRWPRELSMGERQRVAIARALANDPPLLLCDEPTGNLDSKRSSEVLSLLRDICHERTIPGLLVTHDPQAVDYVDRAYTLSDGVLHEGLKAELVLR
jgi:putative ABC transport system ATP-binding protein